MPASAPYSNPHVPLVNGGSVLNDAGCADDYFYRCSEVTVASFVVLAFEILFHFLLPAQFVKFFNFVVFPSVCMFLTKTVFYLLYDDRLSTADFRSTLQVYRLFAPRQYERLRGL